MSEQAADKPEQPKPKRKFPTTVVIIAGITIVQAAGFFVAFKMLGGGPRVTYGKDAGEHVVENHDQPDAAGTAEIPLVDRFKVTNNKSGRLYVYDMDVLIKVPAKKKADVEKLVEERQGEISDCIARIVRGAEQAVLNEDELQTLRLQLRAALGELLGNPELIERVLIPRCVPTRG
jgi:flagellar basal body-associated protein FliL